MARTASSATKMEHVWTRSFQRVPGTGNEGGTYIDEIPRVLGTGNGYGTYKDESETISTCSLTR